MDTLEFLTWYTVFFLFVSIISAQAGVTTFRNSESMEAFIESAPANALNPLWYGGAILTMMTISSEFTFIYIIFVAPFIVGLVWIITCWIRGTTP